MSECALNDSSWNVAIWHWYTHVWSCVDGGSWSQEYCWASGEMLWPQQDYQERKRLARLSLLWPWVILSLNLTTQWRTKVGGSKRIRYPRRPICYIKRWDLNCVVKPIEHYPSDLQSRWLVAVSCKRLVDINALLSLWDHLCQFVRTILVCIVQHLIVWALSFRYERVVI